MSEPELLPLKFGRPGRLGRPGSWRVGIWMVGPLLSEPGLFVALMPGRPGSWRVGKPGIWIVGPLLSEPPRFGSPGICGNGKPVRGSTLSEPVEPVVVPSVPVVEVEPLVEPSVGVLELLPPPRSWSISETNPAIA